MQRLTNEEIAKLHETARKYISMGLRLGQSYSNALHQISPKLHDEISGTDKDPFYLDRLYDNFIRYIYGE